MTIDDRHTAKAMRVLAAPAGNDPGVISGESGASAMGFLLELLASDDLEDLKKQAGLDDRSQILLFSTEGDTDPGNYLDIVWNGKYQSNTKNY